MNKVKSFAGAFEYLSYKRKINSKTTSIQEKSLAKLTNKWEDKNNEYYKKLNERIDKVNNLIGDSNKCRNDFEKEFNSLIDTSEHEKDELLTNNEKDFTELKDKYENQMKMAAPVLYWSNKSERHRWLSIAFSVLIFLWLMIWLWQFTNIAELAVELPNNLIEHYNVKHPPDKGEKLKTYAEVYGDASLPTIGVYVFFSIIFIWVTRIFVRLFLSQIHMWSDASERSTMVQTYLSFLKENQVKDDVDRQIILQSIFRPSATGIVKDEGLPPNVFELITRQK